MRMKCQLKFDYAMNKNRGDRTALNYSLPPLIDFKIKQTPPPSSNINARMQKWFHHKLQGLVKEGGGVKMPANQEMRMETFQMSPSAIIFAQFFAAL